MHVLDKISTFVNVNFFIVIFFMKLVYLLHLIVYIVMIMVTIHNAVLTFFFYLVSRKLQSVEFDFKVFLKRHLRLFLVSWHFSDS